MRLCCTLPFRIDIDDYYDNEKINCKRDEVSIPATAIAGTTHYLKYRDTFLSCQSIIGRITK